MRKLAVFAAFFLLCTVFASCGGRDNEPPGPTPSTPHTPKVEFGEGKTIPDFHYTLLDGSEGYISENDGKPVFLYFWSTQCTPCASDLPELQSAYEKYSDKVLFFAVTSGETSDTVDDYLLQNSLTFPVILDEDKKIQKLLGITSLPKSAVVGSDGVVTKLTDGTMGEEELDKLISNVLK